MFVQNNGLALINLRLGLQMHVDRPEPLQIIVDGVIVEHKYYLIISYDINIFWTKKSNKFAVDLHIQLTFDKDCCFLITSV
jgi:hypothetical protein